jgi:hypothetical protein
MKICPERLTIGRFRDRLADGSQLDDQVIISQGNFPYQQKHRLVL